MRAATQSDGKSTSRKSGDNSEEVTPVPISNTVVKLLSADDTWWEAAWESRTLPVFSYLNLGKIERKNWARSVKRVRASFLLPWFTQDRDKKLRAGARSLRRAPFYLPKYFYYIENIAEQYSYITKKVPCEAVLIHERHMRIEISDFVMRAFVPIQRKDSSHAVFFSFGNVSTFRKDGFLRSSMRHRRKEGNHETCRTAPARYMDVAGFLLPWFTHNRDKKLRTCAPFFLPWFR